MKVQSLISCLKSREYSSLEFLNLCTNSYGITIQMRLLLQSFRMRFDFIKLNLTVMLFYSCDYKYQ